mmetsp:Transcript_40434/g.47311  ORF Transcript_40434/g.47311 Transcript_40434/m.47311 type:complete len:276 (+) Transcript_40434:191-1018(+)|eukprot:CAMPEP_0194385206 /NCGR_PEP_ID=MMETSP0174-20130528/78875_1 /TAXON_ID=216777 /ORGANISM="Proboscia alata, Strain PI-D3" /LENGTH=275 /DNA_ID=CAMNT_0039173117 /DNA_START=166 /DNA_END=993 /DNA_ORIENTATION=+
MLMNYHELTMNESRDSPAKKKQFLVISVGGFGIFLWALVTAGFLSPVQISEGVFVGGGEFVYKPMAKDYASSMGLARAMCSQLDIHEHKWVDIIYALYLDETAVAGPDNRYMVGIFSNDSGPDGEERKRSLLASNNFLEPRESSDTKFLQHKSVPYEVGILPTNIKAAIVHFPYTNGFISLLLNNYKVLPAILRHVKSIEGNDGIENFPVITTCSVEQQMCTHYAPLEQREQFMLGRPDTTTYLKEVEAKNTNSDGISTKNIARGLKRLFGGDEL